MTSGAGFRFNGLKKSLRVRATLLVLLPILLIMSVMAMLHYWQERRLLEDQLQLTTVQLSEVLVGSLNHAMLTNDRVTLDEVLSVVGSLGAFERAQIIDLDRRVRADSLRENLGSSLHRDDTGCKECHELPSKTRPSTVAWNLSSDIKRVATPIVNHSDCAGCHASDDPHLGVLVADVSTANIKSHLPSGLRTELGITVGITVLVTLGVQLIHFLVVRRKMALRTRMAELAAGNFSARLSVSPGPLDELDQVADIFNQMAHDLERYARQQEERNKVRQQAIAEERERIARELHDGLAQLLGYVNTKAMAVRMMLQKQQLEAADQNLLQLEEAARELFVDVRETILELKVTGRDTATLPAMLEDLTQQFSRLDDLPIELILTPRVEDLSLSAEKEFQLLRIVQESLSNVRKHASATRAVVEMRTNHGILELTVSDNGKGFDPQHLRTDRWPHFGLSAMHKRAEAIGADFKVDAKPGAGTCVSVRLPLSDPLLNKAWSKDLSLAWSKED